MKIFQLMKFHTKLQRVSASTLRIRFDKIGGFIRICGCQFRHLVLFDHELFDKISNKVKPS